MADKVKVKPLHKNAHAVEALHALLGEDVRFVDSAVYIGTMAVQLVASEDELTSNAVVQLNRLRDMKEPTAKTLLALSSSHAGSILDKKWTPLQVNPLQDVIHYFPDPKKKDTLVVITSKADLGIAYVHAYKMTDKLVTKAVAVLDDVSKGHEDAAKATPAPASTTPSASTEESGARRRRRTSLMLSSQAKAASDMGLQGCVAGLYLGSVPVKSRASSTIVFVALGELRRRMKKTKTRHLTVVAVFQKDCIRFVEALHEETLSTVYLKDVSDVAIADEGSEVETFCVIEHDDRLDITTCHFLQCEKGLPQRACEMLNRAREAQLQEEERKANDPFYGDRANDVPVSGLILSKQLPRDSLTAVKVLGAGQFGTVHMANYSVDDDVEHDVQVAVKLLRAGSKQEDQNLFRMEAEIMLQLQHPNLLSIMGVCVEKQPWLVVLELMQYGDLRKIVTACKSKNMNITMAEQLTILVQVADGLKYLNSMGFVHMDIAARNVLLHTNNLVKISDFGCTNKLDPETKTFRLRGFLKLAVRWMAPETLTGKAVFFSEKTDVWAFAILAWEVLMQGDMPYGNMKAAEAKNQILAHVLLPLPNTIPEPMRKLLSDCWQKDPAARPTAQGVFTRLVTMKNETASEAQPRDIGATINSLLTGNLRKMSKKASVNRRNSRLPPGAPKLAAVSE
eukprot:m.142385 g.142385  ORF g.142385 m.142385 type:complete len:679 (+) comp16710_c0_seq1:333-2369(+)